MRHKEHGQALLGLYEISKTRSPSRLACISVAAMKLQLHQIQSAYEFRCAVVDPLLLVVMQASTATDGTTVTSTAATAATTSAGK